MSEVGEVRDVRLCVLGFGHVMQRFCELIGDRESLLAREYGVRFLVTAVGTKEHGSFADPSGITPADLLAQFRGTGFAAGELPGVDLVASSDADVLVESTTLTHDGQPAISHIERCTSCRSCGGFTACITASTLSTSRQRIARILSKRSGAFFSSSFRYG